MINFKGRYLQHSFFILGSSGLLINNAKAGSIIGIVASCCFIIGNVTGIILYYRKKKNETNTNKG